jgi:hypothetical protein
LNEKFLCFSDQISVLFLLLIVILFENGSKAAQEEKCDQKQKAMGESRDKQSKNLK